MSAALPIASENVPQHLETTGEVNRPPNRVIVADQLKDLRLVGSTV
jgi:hypothetical protein